MIVRRFENKDSEEVSALIITTLRTSNISVITTLHSKNYKMLDEMYELLKDTGVVAWQLQACSPMGNAANGAIDSAIDFETVISFVRKHLSDSPFPIGVADNIGYYTNGEGSLRGNPSGSAVFTGCRAGLSSIGIDSIGNVRGCESMSDDRFIEGNLRERSLSEIWNDPDAFAYNRRFKKNLLTGKCSKCEHCSVCAGGCRSYNYFTYGKLYESLRCARDGSAFGK